MKKTILIISVLLASLFIVDAEAAIAFRAASSAGVRTPTISYRASGVAASAASGNVTPTLASVELNAFLICLVEQHDNVAISFPAGWTQLYSINTTATHRASAFYKKAAAAEANPLITHTGGNSIIAQCSTFRGVDPGNPLDVAYAAQYAASSTIVTSGSMTTLTANDMMLYAMHIANNPTITVAPAGAGGVVWTQRFYSSTALGLRSATGLYTGTKAAAGAVGPITSTISLASENHGVLMALHNGSRLSIPVPTGTVAGDVMIAAIATTPSTVTITAPAGWTLIQAVTQATATSNRVSTYYRVATATEPASYSWTLSTTHTGAAGGIVTYSGVDNTTPVDVNAGAATVSALTHTAPTITTTIANDMLVTVHEFASAGIWAPPAGPPAMTERVDVASRAASNAGISLEMNELLLGAAGATGAKTATASTVTADTGATVSIALRPAVVAPHHIRIEHDGSASNCAPEPITLKACANTTCTAPHFTLTNVTGITLAATGSGIVWTPANPQTITAASGGINSGITLTRSNAGTATLSITGTPSPAPIAAYECYNTATSTSGDCSLVFSDILSFNVPNHTAGTRQAVTMTVCAGSFASTTRTVKFWSTYVNPATGTQGKIVAGTGNADCATGYSALSTSSATPTSLSLVFGTGTSPQATFSLCYPDVGQVKLDARYDGAAGNTPPDAGVVKLGNSTFIAKPDHFSVSAVKCTTADAANCGAGALPSGNNPAAADASGGSFMRAGDSMAAATRFTATVTAKNALDAATPNYGLESVPEGVKLTSVLVAPTGAGTSPGLLTCKASTTDCSVPGGAANFTSGATTITDLAWDEVGIIQLMPTIIDADYLGTGSLTTPTASGNIGRFIPDHFEVNPDALNPIRVRATLPQTTALSTGTVAPATVIDVNSTTGFYVGSKVRIPGAGAGGNAFTATVTAVNMAGLTLTLDTAIGISLVGGENVFSEWGSYIGERMDAQFVLSATDRNGNITQNYVYSAIPASNFAKLVPTVIGNPLGLGAMDTAGPTYNLALDTSLTATGNFTGGGATIIAPLAVVRGASAVGPYASVKIGIAPNDADGVKMGGAGAYNLGVASATNDHTSIMDPLVQDVTAVRYGRIKLTNAHGSELLSLPITATAQYFDGTSATCCYVTSATDNETQFDTNLSTAAGNVQATIVNGPLTLADVSVDTPGLVTFANGVNTFKLAAPTVAGSVDLTIVTAPSYLLPSTTGRATFGVYKGASEFIYMRENY